MFEYHQNTLCVQSAWIIESEILSPANLKSDRKRGYAKPARIGGNGRTALIEFESLRPTVKEKIAALVGGNPYENAKHQSFTDKIIYNQIAVDFFNEHRFGKNESIPEDTKKKYLLESSILKAIQTTINQSKYKITKRKKAKQWEVITDIVKTLPSHIYPHSLPNHPRRLQEKYENFIKNGYESLIHKNFCNDNSEKLNEHSKLWVLARWMDQVNRCTSLAQLLIEYNHRAEEKNWKKLVTEETLRNYLDRDEVKCLWWGKRNGDASAKEKFGYSHKTILPAMRDSLWYSDGTKLNLYYQYPFTDKNGKTTMKIGTTKVYEVIDTYSEVLLGYHVSDSEDFQAQYFAYKMAIKISGHKPYEIKFDNQSGHKKLENGGFLSKIARIAVSTKPYNGKSKTIESIFGRFQMQFMNQDWISTGQNITTKKIESKANPEFSALNKQDFPTKEGVIEKYIEMRNKWNNAPHPKTGISRLEMYNNSVNPETPELKLWDMVDLFWIERPKEVMYTPSGLEFTEAKVKYSYSIYGPDNEIDMLWHRRNIDNSFIIKFDPEDMSMIYLYRKTPKGLQFVTEARTKTEIHRATQEQKEGEMNFYKNTDNKEKALRIEEYEMANKILEDHGMLAEQYGLKTPGLLGLKSTKTKNNVSSFAKLAKIISDKTQLDEDGEMSEINYYEQL